MGRSRSNRCRICGRGTTDRILLARGHPAAAGDGEDEEGAGWLQQQRDAVGSGVGGRILPVPLLRFFFFEIVPLLRFSTRFWPFFPGEAENGERKRGGRTVSDVDAVYCTGRRVSSLVLTQTQPMNMTNSNS
jgi:hypothetical protein